MGDRQQRCDSRGNTPTTNVFNANNQIGGGSYDAAGNQLAVGGAIIQYDAESRQSSASDPSTLGGATETYMYDGNGNRVEKTGPNGTAVYVYDAFGLLKSEHSTATNNSPCSTCYLSWDHLGSIRMITDQNANVVARHDYLPFGEEITNAAGRSTPFGASDAVEQKFTGQVRDSETGNDFFNARYFTGALGRFTSPDPANAGADPTNPQSWNGYSYVLNNPLRYVDPFGLSCVVLDNGSYADDGDGQGCSSAGVSAGSPDDPNTLNQGQTNAQVNDEGPSLNPWSPGISYGSAYSGNVSFSVTGYGSAPGQTGSGPPKNKVCTSSGYTNTRNFVNSFSNPADQIAQKLKTTISNILGLAGFESGWGTGPLIKAGTNNYFSLKAGPAFATGATGIFQLGANAFETYPSFQAAGNAFASSYFGARVTGITDPVAFAQALNAGGRYNSEQRNVPYNTTLVNSINLSAQVLQCH